MSDFLNYKLFFIYAIIFMVLTIIWVIIRRLIDRKNGKVNFSLKEEFLGDAVFLLTFFMSSICFAIAAILKIKSILQG